MSVSVELPVPAAYPTQERVRRRPICQPTPVNIGGCAHLCFSEDGSWFQGHLITCNDESQYGLLGQRTGPESYDVTVIDHDDGETYAFPTVLSTAGPLCSLSSPHLTFVSREAYRGQRADMLIQKYLTPRLVGNNLKVYAGQLTVDLNTTMKRIGNHQGQQQETMMWCL